MPTEFSATNEDLIQRYRLHTALLAIFPQQTKHASIEFVGDECVASQQLDARVQDTLRENVKRWAQRVLDGAASRRTVDAWISDLSVLARWCKETSRVGLPARQDTLEKFIDSFRDQRKVTNLRRYISTIGTVHKAAGLPNPAGTERIRDSLTLTARQQARHDQNLRERGLPMRWSRRQARPLRSSQLRLITERSGSSLRDLRDVALLWTAYDSLFRRSEITAMRLEDIYFEDRDGSAVVLLPFSKTDQLGSGDQRYLSPYTVRKLINWITSAGIHEGRVFRAVLGNGPSLGPGLSGQVVSRIYKQSAAKIGLGPVGYSGHSTRVGAAQDMLSANIGLLAIQHAGGWKSDHMPLVYAAGIRVKESGSAQLARLDGRAEQIANESQLPLWIAR